MDIRFACEYHIGDNFGDGVDSNFFSSKDLAIVHGGYTYRANLPGNLPMRRA